MCLQQPLTYMGGECASHYLYDQTMNISQFCLLIISHTHTRRFQENSCRLWRPQEYVCDTSLTLLTKLSTLSVPAEAVYVYVSTALEPWTGFGGICGRCTQLPSSRDVAGYIFWQLLCKQCQRHPSHVSSDSKRRPTLNRPISPGSALFLDGQKAIVHQEKLCFCSTM